MAHEHVWKKQRSITHVGSKRASQLSEIHVRQRRARGLVASRYEGTAKLGKREMVPAAGRDRGRALGWSDGAVK